MQKSASGVYFNFIISFVLGIAFTITLFPIFALLKLGYQEGFLFKILSDEDVGVLLNMLKELDWALITISIVLLLLTFVVNIKIFKNFSRQKAVNTRKPSSSSQDTEDLINAFSMMTSSIENRRKSDVSIKIEEQNEYLVNISHELRTPMHTILNLAEVGYTDIEKLSKEKISYLFQRIEKSGDRLVHILNSILDITKLEEDKVAFVFKEEDFKQCLEDINMGVSDLFVEKKLTLNTIYKTDNTNLLIDKEAICKVMMNLVSNAVKFSPEEKNIEIIVSQISVKNEKNKDINVCKVEVTDCGPGVPEKEKEEIFKKFVQSSRTKTEYSGSGLGLAICKQIIDKHGGQIWVENLLNGGANFVFTIPMES